MLKRLDISPERRLSLSHASRSRKSILGLASLAWSLKRNFHTHDRRLSEGVGRKVELGKVACLLVRIRVCDRVDVIPWRIVQSFYQSYELIYITEIQASKFLEMYYSMTLSYCLSGGIRDIMGREHYLRRLLSSVSDESDDKGSLPQYANNEEPRKETHVWRLLVNSCSFLPILLTTCVLSLWAGTRVLDRLLTGNQMLMACCQHSTSQYNQLEIQRSSLISITRRVIVSAPEVWPDHSTNMNLDNPLGRSILSKGLSLGKPYLY